MRKRFLIFVAAALGAVASGLGQQTAGNLPPLPEGPLVRLRAPESSRWVVTDNPRQTEDSQPSEDKSQKPFSRKTQYTKAKGFILVQTAIPSRPTQERWIVNDVQYTKNLRTKQYVGYTLAAFPGGKPNESLYTDLSQTDFPGFEWIKKEDYAGIRKVMGRECIVYHRSGEGADTTAYVDARTRYPVALRIGNETRAYEFQRAPAVQLPAEIQKDLQQRAPKKTP